VHCEGGSAQAVCKTLVPAYACSAHSVWALGERSHRILNEIVELVSFLDSNRMKLRRGIDLVEIAEQPGCRLLGAMENVVSLQPGSRGDPPRNLGHDIYRDWMAFTRKVRRHCSGPALSST
jgi:hypothetical protein